jgi:EAL domain-containing protein (putative c-di-GMP-specific phosphodiesterase class I)
LSTPNIKPEAPAADSASRAAAESLGWQLRAALPPLRLHSVSLHDFDGEALWLSEGVLGPDEHGFVVEALDDFKGNPSGTHRESDFRDGRGAVFLAIRAPRAELAGLVMILVDGKALAAGGLAARIMTPTVHAVMQRLAMGLSPLSKAASVPAPAPTEPDSPLEITLELLAPQDVDEILTFELAQEALLPPRAATPSHATTEPAAQDCGSGLRIQELTHLRPGGRMRRFQLLPQAARSDAAPASADAAAQMLVRPLQELVSWLGAHPQIRARVPLTFSLSVPASAIEAENLPDLVADCLGNQAVRADGIGFQIEEAVYVQHRSPTERFVRTVEELGSFLVLDDFTFDSGALELLRSKALRLVKVHPDLIAAALRDKLAQARIVAISQAARVLGIHCSAKRVDGQAARRWLTAAGFDFAEGPLFDAPLALASLAAELAEPK